MARVAGAVLGVVVGLASLLPVMLPTARAAPGLQFLDDRPIVIDLDHLPSTPRWQVSVLQGQSNGPHRLQLHVLFQPSGSFEVTQSPPSPVPTGDVAMFVITLKRPVTGSGQLVVTSSDGSAARRPIRTASLEDEEGLLPSQLRFAGTRLSPFGGDVRIGPIEVAASPGSSSEPLRLGTIVSDGGDLADVVRNGDTFDVVGAERPGEYTGTVDLLPGVEGGDVKITATVRDSLGWPLAVLVLGLVAVQQLERYQKRVRPRRDLARRLAALFDTARVAQERIGGRFRIARATGSDLCLDHAANGALAAWDRGRSDAEWRTWEPEGASFNEIKNVVDAFKRLTEDVVRLEAERDRALEKIRPYERQAAVQALEDSPVGAALLPAAFSTPEEIHQAAQQVVDGRAHLRRFVELYEVLKDLSASDVPDKVREAAAAERAKLFRVPDLDPIEKAVDALVQEWRPAPRPVARPAPVAVPARPAAHAAPAGVPPAVPPPTAATASPRVGQVSRWIGLAAVIVVLLAFSGSLVMTGRQSSGPVAGGSIPTTTEPLLDAPVAPLPTLPRAGIPDEERGRGSVAWEGFVLPILSGAALLGVIKVISQGVRRRRKKPTDEFDSKRIDKILRQEDFRFALASGVFVVASGMSLLYFSKATFGGIGDYLSVALWGTAVGEGVQLARRLLPVGR